MEKRMKELKRKLSIVLVVVMITGLFSQAPKRAIAQTGEDYSWLYSAPTAFMFMPSEKDPLMNSYNTIRPIEENLTVSGNSTVQPLTASVSKLSFDASGGTKTFTIGSISKPGATITAERNANWFTASVSGTTVTIKVEKNSGAARSSSVEVVDRGNGKTVKVTISQSKAPTPTPTKKPTPTPTKKPTPTPTKRPSPTPIPKLTVSPSSISVNSSAQSKSITLGNVFGSSTIRADRSVGWLTVSGTGGSFTISITANTSYQSRSGKVSFTDTSNGRTIDVTVTQSAAPTPTPIPKLTVSPSSISVNSSAQSKKITLGNVFGSSTIRADRSVGWLTVSGSGGSFTVSITANTSYQPRSGKISFTDTSNGRTIDVTVTQSAAPTPTPTPTNTPTPTKPAPTNTPTPIPKLTVNPSSISVSSAAQSKNITLGNVFGSSTIRADRSVGWLTVSGSGGSFTVSITANTSYQPRSGKISFTDTSNGRTIDVTVTQSAAPTPTPTPTNTPTPTKSPAPTNTPTPTKPPVPTNTPTPTKAPTPIPKLMANPTSISVSSAAQSKKVMLGNVFGSSTIRADRSVGWLTVSGTGGSFTISITANTSYQPRSGKVTFTDTSNGRSVDVAVNQAGASTPTPVAFDKPTPTARPTPPPIATYYVFFDEDGGTETVTINEAKGDVKVESAIPVGGGPAIKTSQKGNKVAIIVDKNLSTSNYSWTVIVVQGTKEIGYYEIKVAQTGAPKNTPTPRPTATPKPTSPATRGQTPINGTPTATATPMPTMSPSQTPATTTPTPTPTVTYIPPLHPTPAPTSVVIIVKPTPTPVFTLKLKPDKVVFTDYKESVKQVKLSGFVPPANLEIHADTATNGWATVKLDDAGSGTLTIHVASNESVKRSGNVEIVDRSNGNSIKLPIEQEGKGFNVRFDANGGSNLLVKERIYYLGEYYELPDGPAGPDGAKFLGWFTQQTGGEEITDLTRVKKDISVLYARYKTGIEVKLDTKSSYGETVIGPSYAYVHYGEKYGDVFPVVVDPKGYRIVGWKNAKGEIIDKNTIVTDLNDHTLTAVWLPFTEYLLVYDGNGNKDGRMECKACKYGESIQLDPLNYDTKASFEVWSTSPNGGGECYRNESYIIRSAASKVDCVRLYAIWEKHTVKYHELSGKVIYDASGPVSHCFTTISEKDHPELTIKGITFVGWKDGKDSVLGGDVDFKAGKEYISEDDLDLYPVYEKEKKDDFVIIFSSNGGSGGPGSMSIPADAVNVVLPEYIPVYDKRHTFVCWQLSLEVPITTFDIKIPLVVQYEPGCKMDLSPIQQFALKGLIRDYIVLKAQWKCPEEKVILDHQYGGITSSLETDNEGYVVLPSIERNGYQFCGWGSNKTDVSYTAGTRVYVPDEGLKLYAIWNMLFMKVEYYDCFTNTCIASSMLDVNDSLAGELRHVDGLIFSGWTTKNARDYTSDPSLGVAQSCMPPEYKPREPMKNVSFAFETLVLYSCYTVEDEPQDDESIKIVYIPNGGRGAPGSTICNYDRDGYIEIQKSEMTRTSCTFDGWVSLETGALTTNGPFYGGEKVNITTYRPVVWLIAKWKPTTHLYLDYGLGEPAKDVSGKFLPNEVVLVESLDDNVPKNDGHYLKGFETPSGYFYSVKSMMTIPNYDLTLKAVWGSYGFSIYYHNGFDPEMFTYVHYDEPFKMTDSTEGLYGIDVPGYKFAGWTYDNPGGEPCDISSNKIIKNGTKITCDGYLHLYSCYTELGLGADHAGQVMVVYNPCGGVGGPGVEYYNPRIGLYTISTIEPTKKGYVFRGWSFDPSPQYPKYDVDTFPCKCYEAPVENKLTLYAVWLPEVSNNLKNELQNRFGEEAMPDYIFMYEYISPTWRKIDDFTYYVIRTDNEGDTSYIPQTRSRVMLIQFKNGEWYFETPGILQNPIRRIEFDISIHNKDGYAQAILLGLKALKDAARFIPIVNYAVISMDILCALEDAFYGSSADTACMALASSLLEFALSASEDKLIEMGFDGVVALEAVNSVAPDMYEWAKNEATTIADDLAYIAEVGSTGASLVAKLMALQEKVNKSMNETSKSFLGRMLDVKGSFELGKYDLIGTLTDITTDIIRYSTDNSNLDMFGDQDFSLKTFQDELSLQGFGDVVVNSFPDILAEVYMSYYGLK